MYVKQFWENLRYLRKQCRLTQEEMGKILGMKRSTYAYWENYGTIIPTGPQIIEFLAEYGYTIEFLMTTDLRTNSKTIIPKPIFPTNNTKSANKNSVTMHLNYISRKLRNVKQRLIL